MNPIRTFLLWLARAETLSSDFDECHAYIAEQELMIRHLVDQNADLRDALNDLESLVLGPRHPSNGECCE